MAESAPEPAINGFVPALIIVDYQNDFCPPSGAVPVPDGDTLAPVLNELLSLPFALKIATRDWHPPDHISFHTSNRPTAQPPHHPTTVRITHPAHPSKTYTTPLWPPHCIAHTPGASLHADLHSSALTHTISKGLTRSLEMFSAFRDPFGLEDSGLAAILHERGVTDVFVVGLALEYCVKCTAVDARGEGFKVVVVSEGVGAVDAEEGEVVRREMEEGGVGFVGLKGEEVSRVREWDGR